MSTLLLGQSQLKGLVDPSELMTQLRDGFRDYSQERKISGKRFYSPLTGPGDLMVLAPGLSTGIPAYTVKVNAKFPKQTPSIRGALNLNDLQTGALLAIMDSTYITALRTGMGAAVATDILARRDADRVAVVGAGMQGRYQLRYLSLLRPLSAITVYDTNAHNASAFVDQMGVELELPVQQCDTLDAAIGQADIILVATWATRPFLTAAMVRPGCHITTLGADQPDEAEIGPDLIRQALFVCDDRDLAVSMGAIGGAGLESEWIDAELGEVIAGLHEGRTNPEQITIYGAVGVAFQDLIAAWHVYQAALRRDVGVRFDFSA